MAQSPHDAPEPSYYGRDSGGTGLYHQPRRTRGLGLACIIVGVLALVWTGLGYFQTARLIGDHAWQVISYQLVASLPTLVGLVLLIVAGVALRRR